MKQFLQIFVCGLLPALLSAQVLNNGSLSGDYHFVQILINENGGVPTNVRNLGGTVTFDGAGGFAFTGKLGTGAAAPTASAGGGAYMVEANGFTTLTNPIDGTLEINARLGADGEAIIGTTTETEGGAYDLFMAIKAPTAADNSVLSGSYTGGTLAFPGGTDAALTTALLSLEANGAGAFTALTARGHAINAGEVNVEQANAGATYAIAANGTGTLDLAAGTTLFNGDRDIFVSANGNFLIGYSTETGGREMFVAIRNLSDSADDSDWSGNYWFAEVILDPEFGSFTSATGGLSTLGTSFATISERLSANRFVSDFSAVNSYEINADSQGQLAATLEADAINMGLGAPSSAKGVAVVPQAAVGAQINALTTTSFFHGLFIAIRMPAFSGEGVFLNPLGVVNGASFAPPTFPIAPGTLVALVGTGLSATTTGATVTPLPTNLGNVSVAINGISAPLFFVSPGQIAAQVPFAAAENAGNTATIVVTNNGVASNSVQVPLAATSPGIFSFSQNGLGAGIIVDSFTFEPNSPTLPASEGDFVSIFLTGLGAVDPAIGDGFPAPAAELALATDPGIEVLFGFSGTPGRVTYAGGAPNFVSLYQINVEVPALDIVGPNVPVAMVTSNGWSDFVTIAIEF
ncbi:MAG TPA: IPT/TIG domain-containing protein [Bryobacterales bacterium]|nr:IPT/TIG domain-containing protein [Bryobacterales bacterium]